MLKKIIVIGLLLFFTRISYASTFEFKGNLPFFTEDYWKLLKGEYNQIKVGGNLFKAIEREKEKPLLDIKEQERERSYIIYQRNIDKVFPHSIPKREEIKNLIATFSAQGEIEPFYFTIYTLKELEKVKVKVDDFIGENSHHRIKKENIELKIVVCYPKRLRHTGSTTYKIVPHLLFENTQLDIPRDISQSYYLNLNIPSDTPSGRYISSVKIIPENSSPYTLKLGLKVLPFSLIHPKNKCWLLWEGLGEVKDIFKHKFDGIKLGRPYMAGSFEEKDGRINKFYFYKFIRKLLLEAKELGMKGPTVITFPYFHRWVGGWSKSEKDALIERTKDSPYKGDFSLKVANFSNSSRSAIGCPMRVLILPGEKYDFKMVYKTEGNIVPTVGISFLSSRQGREKLGKVSIKADSTGGTWKTVEKTFTTPIREDTGKWLFTSYGIQFKGKGTLWLDEVRIEESKDKKYNSVLNSGFERVFEYKNKDYENWPESLQRDFSDAVRAVKEEVESFGWECLFEGRDETGHGNMGDKYLYKCAKDAGIKTWCNLIPEAVSWLEPNLDTRVFYSQFFNTESTCKRMLDDAKKAGDELWTINAGAYSYYSRGFMPNRYLTGLFFYKTGCSGTAIWPFSRVNGSPYNDFDAGYVDWCLVYPSLEQGKKSIIPSLPWEGLREGIKDVYYIATLKDTIKKVEEIKEYKKEAKAAKQMIESLLSSLPWYTEFMDKTTRNQKTFTNNEADRLRWLVANQTLKLNTFLKGETLKEKPIKLNYLENIPVEEIPKRMIECPFIKEKEPILDGKLIEAFWEKANKVKGFFLYNTKDTSPEVNTEVYLGYTDKNLYLGFVCYEPYLEQLRTDVKERDGMLWGDDSIEIFLDTDNSGKTYYHFVINPVGEIYDSQCEILGKEDEIIDTTYTRYKRHKAWDSSIKISTWKGKDKWQIELSIPLSELKVKSSLWGVNFTRNRIPEGRQLTSFSPIFRSFHNPNYFSYMLFSDTLLENISLPSFTSGKNTIFIRLKNTAGRGKNVQVSIDYDKELENRWKRIVKEKITVGPGTSIKKDISFKLNKGLGRLKIDIKGKRSLFLPSLSIPPLLNSEEAVIIASSSDKKIEGSLGLRIKEENIKEYKLGIILKKREKTLFSSIYPLATNNLKYTIDIRKLLAGDYIIEWVVLKDGQPVEESERKIIIVEDYWDKND